MKSYKCPKCGEIQTSAISWETISVAYEFNLVDGESEEVDKVGGDHECWACPGCGQDLPSDLVEKVEKQLGWRK